MAFINWIEEPALRRPVMILAMAGWNDASSVASTSVRFLIDRWQAKKFAEIDPEEFFSFTRIRPQVRLDENEGRIIVWPETGFYYHVDPLLDRDFVLLIGIEPSFKWRTFSEAIVQVCQEAHISSVLSLGGLAAQVPHTLAARVTGSTSDPDLAAQFPDLAVRRSRYEGPTGIVGVLSDMLNRAGIPTGSLWGNVPHYISASPNPKVAHGLLTRLNGMFGLGLDLDDMARSGRRFERQVNEALAQNPEVAQYVKQLEQAQADGEATEPLPEAPPESSEPSDLPRGEDVVRHLEEFLRQQRSKPGDADPEGQGD
ncbi:MAG: PAC2 family protein [Chloroflexi bacterium]|nr:PAC2 family protein [Chloroflexota bacterium]